MSKVLKNRDEILEKDKWKVDKIFKSDEDFENANRILKSRAGTNRSG